MIDNLEEDENPSFWASVSDLFLTLFVVSFAILGAVFYVLLPRNPPASVSNLILSSDGIELDSIRNPTNRMRGALGSLEVEGSSSAKAVVGGLNETADEVVRIFKDQKSELFRIKELERKLVESHLKLEQAEVLRKIMEDLEQKLKAQNIEIDNPKQIEEMFKKLQEKLSDVNEELLAAKKALNDKPPIIEIADAANSHFFGSGSATVSGEFLEALSNAEFSVLAGEILRRNSGEKKQVDTLEIIGHTDGQPIKRMGNLDGALPRLLAGEYSSLENLIPGSNNDLGLLRALSIREAWRKFVSQHDEREKLSGIDVRCYSAGQTVPRSGDVSDPKTYFAADESFRRIEVRLTKLANID